MDEVKLKQPIFLCGMMGSGKSTAGRTLADLLGVAFIDLDELIVEKAGMTIPEIFEKEGESAFREMERKILIRESQYFKGVMALGGGSLQNQHIVDHLKIYGWLVFLDVPLSVISDRISGDSNRPMLKGENPDRGQSKADDKIQHLLKQRRPLYEQAEITIHAGDQSADDVAHELIKRIKLYDGFNRR